jgi:hypothetical protein
MSSPVDHLLEMLHFEPLLDALSLRPNVMSSVKIPSLQYLSCGARGSVPRPWGNPETLTPTPPGSYLNPYRGASLIRNTPLLGTYSRTIPGVL